jgi:hypothetical protein
LPAIVALIELRAMLQQEFQVVDSTCTRRPVRGTIAIVVGLIHVGAGIDQHRHCITGIVFLSGTVQRSLSVVASQMRVRTCRDQKREHAWMTTCVMTSAATMTIHMIQISVCSNQHGGDLSVPATKERRRTVAVFCLDVRAGLQQQ